MFAQVSGCYFRANVDILDWENRARLAVVVNCFFPQFLDHIWRNSSCKLSTNFREWQRTKGQSTRVNIWLQIAQALHCAYLHRDWNLFCRQARSMNLLGIFTTGEKWNASSVGKSFGPGSFCHFLIHRFSVFEFRKIQLYVGCRRSLWKIIAVKVDIRWDWMFKSFDSDLQTCVFIRTVVIIVTVLAFHRAPELLPQAPHSNLANFYPERAHCQCTGIHPSFAQFLSDQHLGGVYFGGPSKWVRSVPVPPSYVI